MSLILTLIILNVIFLLYVHYKDVNEQFGKLRGRKDFDKIQYLIITYTKEGFHNNFHLLNFARYIILVFI